MLVQREHGSATGPETVKGEGSIFEQQPGLWRGVLELGMVNGKRVRRTYLGKTRRVAQQLAAAVTTSPAAKGSLAVRA